MYELLPWAVIVVGLLVLIARRVLGGTQGLISKEALEEARSYKEEAGGKIETAGFLFSIVSVMPEVISLLILGSGLFIILSGSYPDAQQKWAFGVVGTILGHWLSPRSKVK